MLRARLVGWLLLALVTFAVHGDVHVATATPREYKHTTDPAILSAAQFALDELRRLSDTGIYMTLSLHAVTSGATQTGDFHDNTYLMLELASPHFKSGAPVESFEVVVMESRDGDRRKSFAIDNFPEMAEEAIEAYWIEMVEATRAKRRNVFAKWAHEQQEPSVTKDEL
ncbi:hypothetical protein SDRG_04352 [Saprolegnia diclina VS20]|uniref:Uncharacterized protein n=1 Tax=Saprolegnia diclina (strain VS20) TaxID=1156394 RepID=T0QX73_SAPDV|nr:hypothetical protein SDRG_04352 [Saprolegnia diclina VS20]EQC38655.1 hypothetical protein SDRG_04352 [Saprolegnia diclina VS20]|eukprot:XP_008608247.1 hypothetical protein SDRG_04352 [Saprolegnia diclina VS20]